jgi:hypothetical protein
MFTGTYLTQHFKRHFLSSRVKICAVELWEVWFDPETAPLRTCTIITTPNPVTAPIHARLPVILPPEGQSAWLSRESSPEQLSGSLVPHSRRRDGKLWPWPKTRFPKRDVVRPLECEFFLVGCSCLRGGYRRGGKRLKSRPRDRSSRLWARGGKAGSVSPDD